MKEYSAFLVLKPINDFQIRQIKSIAEKYNLHIDIGDSHLEFEYSGRDSNRFVVKFLRDIAPTIGKAFGEVVCEIINDDRDNDFEFYQIRDGKLLFQPGKIVRGQEQIID